MVTEDTVEEEKTPKKSRVKKSPYDFIESDAANPADMSVYTVRVKETDEEGRRAWKEYKVAATGDRMALKLVGHNNYDPVNIVDGGSYEA